MIHTSGFKVAVVEQHWNAIQETYQGFDLEELAHMTVTKDLLEALPIAHNGKVQGFLDGCRIVRTRGWRQYKDQLRQELKRRGDEVVMAVLEELPYIGYPSHLFHPSQKPWNFASPPDALSGMHKIIEIFADRAALHTEILALRQQVAVLKRKRPRPLLRKAVRVFWVILS